MSVPSLDVFFRWLFDKKFLADGTVRFEYVSPPSSPSLNKSRPSLDLPVPQVCLSA